MLINTYLMKAIWNMFVTNITSEEVRYLNVKELLIDKYLGYKNKFITLLLWQRSVRSQKA